MWDQEINKVFTDSENNSFAKSFLKKLKTKFEEANQKLSDIEVHVSKVPDFRLKINRRVFLCMQRSCGLHFYLQKDKTYPLINIIQGSQHTHAIKGQEIKNLSQDQLNIVLDYVMQAYYKFK